MIEFPYNIIIGDNHNNILLETPYISKAYLYIEFRECAEHEFTDDQLVEIADVLHNAYMKCNVPLKLDSFVHAIRDFSYNEIKEMTKHDIIDMTFDIDE